MLCHPSPIVVVCRYPCQFVLRRSLPDAALLEVCTTSFSLHSLDPFQVDELARLSTVPMMSTAERLRIL